MAENIHSELPFQETDVNECVCMCITALHTMGLSEEALLMFLHIVRMCKKY